MSCSNFDIDSDCTDSGYPTEFDADPDVAGIGVILAFLISAWATFLFVLITFLFVDSLDEGIGPPDNILDERVVRRTREFKKKWLRPLLPKLLREDRPFSFGAIVNIAFALSDQQLITGMSIIITGFARHCVITQYHFFVVYNLGILSFITHQSTMMIVGTELRDCHWKRWWRLAVIFLVFAFTFATNIAVNNWYFLAEFSLVMQCVWSKLPHYYTPRKIVETILTSCFLFWGLVAIIRDICPDVIDSLKTRLGPLLKPFSLRKWHVWTSAKLAAARPIQDSRMVQRVSSAFLLVCFTAIQIMSSQIVDLYRIWTTLFYSTYTVIVIREQAARAITEEGNPALRGEENTWGFGQILPLLLLLLPGTQVWEMVWNELEENKEKKDTGSTNDPRQPSSFHYFNLETGTGNANLQTESSGFTENDFVENLYDSWWFIGWLWFWVLVLFGATTYGATQGITI